MADGAQSASPSAGTARRSLPRTVLAAGGALALALVALVVMANARIGGTSDIVVADAWARPAAVAQTGTASGVDTGIAGTMAGDTNSVVYLTIINRGGGRDKLTGVSSDASDRVELHYTAIENNVASMSMVRTVEVPKQGTVRFTPGGYHLVLVRVRRDLRPGDTITLSLTFEHAGVVSVAVIVREL